MVLREFFSGSSTSLRSDKSKHHDDNHHASNIPPQDTPSSSSSTTTNTTHNLKPHSSGTPLAPSNSHRFFLRKKSSRGSITPQTSPSSSGSIRKDKKSAATSSSTSLGSVNQRFVSASNSIDGSHNDSSIADAHHPEERPQEHPEERPHEHPAEPSPNHPQPPKAAKDSSDDRKRGKHPEHRSRHHHHHHLSLRRFLNKLKNSDSHGGSSKDRTSTPPSNTSSELYKKYGSVGKLLGTGASGSVNLVTSASDPHKIYAVKKFRSKLPTESEADYKVRVKNEFKIGEFAKHENLIHTFELIKDYPGHGGARSSKLISDPEYYMVMEYCPFDFFNLVMSGLMLTEETLCYFKHIVNGVAFLHKNGLAHRDLKLDNCVVSRDGILKLIDYGSAVQFKKEIGLTTSFNPSYDELVDENHKLVRARGVVGSDPYLAPEVMEPSNFGYDPRHADVWSVAVVFSCMILKRFPWKIPKVSDPSYRSFAGIEDIQDKKPVHESLSDLSLTTSSSSVKKVARGPDRLLRLLPAESRELIRNMLTIDPTKRYLMDEVVEDEFFKSIKHCHTVHDLHGKASVFKPDNHKHHLVTEDELQQLTMEKERQKKLKDAGVA
ncbi:Pkinase-domain-containing protein [Suhomyces tanzawaensis NRRL Y-17324]|uniref:non-specific serine/threonine protein kinase n=1 Tax=Suhomyces tanzawaensis NRRL Y-17324 TaxID=984487 RepID=A0A1E4SBX2_9ASCO|nr:Pkinase-domain-containing protein [Suhomyces tanzawaensis NRRL Y-17324]ODV76892.1 Pkinase-domain-containing protein [Suhomyces tanzawaensis NRRL Y-17324]